jgi:chromate transporter
MASPDSFPADLLRSRPSLVRILQAFLWIGCASFGGGRTTYFQDELVVRRRWITNEEFLEAVAIAQVLPGPTVGNLAAYLGQRLGGTLAAFLAVACLTVPGGLMILALAWLYFRGMPASVTGPLGRGVSAASAGLAVAAIIRLREGVRGFGGMAVAGLVFCLFGPLHWPIHWVLLATLPPACLLAWRARP